MKITIEGATLNEIFNELATYGQNLPQPATSPTEHYKAELVAAKEEKKSRKSAKEQPAADDTEKAAETKAPAFIAKEAEAASKKKAEEAAPAEDPEDILHDGVSMKMVRAAAMVIVKGKGGKPAVLKLLEQFGVASTFELKPEQYKEAHDLLVEAGV